MVQLMAIHMVFMGGNTSGYNNAHGLGHNAQDHEPMEMGNVNASENFHTPPQNPTYQ